jgi:hypothetical protein
VKDPRRQAQRGQTKKEKAPATPVPFSIGEKNRLVAQIKQALAARFLVAI